MSESQMSDSKFAKYFFLMIGLLILLTLTLVIMANLNSREVRDKVSAEKQVEKDSIVAQRVVPVGSMNVGALPEPDGASAAASTASGAEAPEQAAVASGDQVYAQACAMCHDPGIAGAPKTGDAEAWVERLAQDLEVIYGHAINGFQGNAGLMPAKGGNASLSDEAVRAAVDYMIEKSR